VENFCTLDGRSPPSTVKRHECRAPDATQGACDQWHPPLKLGIWCLDFGFSSFPLPSLALASRVPTLRVVDVSISLPDPDLLRAYLAEMDPRTQARGQEYFRQGFVHEVRQTSPTTFEATVDGSESYDVFFRYTSQDGWDGQCSCPVEDWECKHLYAFGKALLAEHSVASVQSLSRLKADAAENVTSAPRSGRGLSLAEEVRAALGRELSRDEAEVVKRISLAYARVEMSRAITPWDFNLMGLPLGGSQRQQLVPMQIWPAFPKNVREFWNYVAREAARRGVPIPEFLRPITNVQEIEAALAAAQRARHIEQWRQRLGQAHPREREVPAAKREVDLRLRLGRHTAVLEWKNAGQSSFSAIKPMQFRQLLKDVRDGAVTFPGPAEWLWHWIEPRIDDYYPADIQYYMAEDKAALARLFRLPEVQSRLVNERGEPYMFVPEPLRWHVTAPENENGDYRLAVRQQDGKPLPDILTVLPGRPALYVTADRVFRGPPVRDDVLDVTSENVIPAPAIETRGGVALLHALGVELPERLREHVRIVPLTLRFSCELRPSYPGSKTEQCAIRVEALADDDDVAVHWNGYDWHFDQRGSGQDRRTGIIKLHDRSALHDPLSLLAPLDAKWEGYRDEFTVRVTRKFPDAFAAWLKSLPRDVKVELHGDLASLQADAVVGSVRLDVTEAGIDWFDLRVVLDVNDTTLTPLELKLLLNARGGFVRLEKKGWRRLQFNLTDEEDEQLARLGLTARELTAEPQRLHALQLADKAARKFLPEPQVERIERRVGEIKARVTPEIPPNVTAELRPYQRDGFHFLAYLSANKFGGILADDMGLGKTLQTLAWLEWVRTNVPPASCRAAGGDSPLAGGFDDAPSRQDAGGTLPSLVVCPKSVMDNWRAEAERFVPGLRVKVWHAAELKGLIDGRRDADLHVLNYNQLRSLGESLAPVQWLAVILDEGQYIKNPSSVTAQIARQLRAEHRLVLSGTPIENRLMDLWSLMAFAMPGALGSRAQFSKLYDSKEDPFARRRLSARVRPFLLRRTKSQVAKDLPERIEEDLFCEIEGEQKTLYRAELKRAQQMLLRVQTQKQLAQERFNFLTSLLRLRQICCHPKLVKADSKAESAKAEALLEQLEPLMDEGHKVLVFSQFVQMLELLRAEIKKRDWPHFYLAGETENRGELVQKFQSAEGAAVFLISLKAGGFGLNLTAASYVVLFDPWWNPAVENQAIDRTHRIGQERNVIAYRLLIKDSIEEKIRALQKRKSSLAEDVLGEEKFSQSLTLDDLHFLFSDA